MYATQKHLYSEVPELELGANCGCLLTIGSIRPGVEEGGLRTKGQYKRALPDLPLVTVVTVVRNCVSTLEHCLRSVLLQSYENIEYLIVDGASTDGSLEIIKRYAEALDYFVSETDSGIYNAMNKGLQLARGDYVLMLNADDWYREDAVKLLVGTARESGADITHADAWVFDESGQRKYLIRGWLDDGIYTRGMPLRHETMLIARDSYNKYGGYDESYEIISDYVWTTKAYTAGCTFSHLDEPILNFCGSGVSNTGHTKRIAERRRFFSQLFPFLDHNDLAIISNQVHFDLSKKLELISKHQGKSELLTRSIAYNIAKTRSAAAEGIWRRLVNSLRKSRIWPWIPPLIRKLKKTYVNRMP